MRPEKECSIMIHNTWQLLQCLLSTVKALKGLEQRNKPWPTYNSNSNVLLTYYGPKHSMLLKIAMNDKVPGTFTDMGSLICNLVENYSEGQTDDIKLFWPKNFLIKILFWWRDVKKKN